MRVHSAFDRYKVKLIPGSTKRGKGEYGTGACIE